MISLVSQQVEQPVLLQGNVMGALATVLAALLWQEATVTPSSLAICGAGSLAANLLALTLRSERRGKPVLPPLCA